MPESRPWLWPGGAGRRAVRAGAMDEFVSTFTNRLDAKGRVSIPASFRAVLSRDGFDGVYCFPTLDRPAIDAGGNRFRAIIRQSLGQLEPLSEEHDFLSTALIGESEVLKLDADGRVVLSERLISYAGLVDQVVLVGQAFKFQLWEPGRFATYRDEARSRLRDVRQRLGTGHRGPGADPGGQEP